MIRVGSDGVTSTVSDTAYNPASLKKYCDGVAVDKPFVTAFECYVPPFVVSVSERLAECLYLLMY